MADLDFYASPQEGLEFAQFFLERGCWLAPDKLYAKPMYDQLRTIEGVKSAQVASDWPVNWFFVGRDDFCTLPLVINQIKDGPNARPENVGKWTISQRLGGATIDLHLGINLSVMHEKRLLGSGFVSHYPDYWDEKITYNYPAPEALKSLYKEAVEFIKSHGRRWRMPEGNLYWVCDGAVEMLEQGYSLGLTGYEDPKKVLALLPPKKRRKDRTR